MDFKNSKRHNSLRVSVVINIKANKEILGLEANQKAGLQQIHSNEFHMHEAQRKIEMSTKPEGNRLRRGTRALSRRLNQGLLGSLTREKRVGAKVANATLYD